MKIINVIKKGFVGCSKNIEENSVLYRAHDWLGKQHIIAYHHHLLYATEIWNRRNALHIN
jgi:hypothetical protein